jgi:hypothetical protein
MISLTISELDTITKINDYLNSLSVNDNVTTKMIIRNFNVSPKIVHRILKYRKDTMLCSPYEFGSYKFINYNLYKKVDDSIIEKFVNLIKKKNNNISSMKQHLMNKYRINYDTA